MGGFFIPGIGAGGGGGGNLPANVITGVRLDPVNNGLIFTYNTGATTDIPLNDVVENLTADQIKDVRLNGKTLVVEQVDGQQTTIALTNVLDAVDINFTPTPDIQSTDVQGAIVEVNDKVGDAYNDSEYDEVNGKLILKKPNGQEDEYRLAGLDRDNLFLGHNTFNEVILMGKTPFVGTVKSEATTTGHKAGVYCGMRTISTHHDNPPQGSSRYVSAIKIKVINSLVVGEKINDVYVTEMKKTSDRTTDIVGKTIVSGGTFIVEDDVEYGKCIFVPIHKDYTEDTYFIIGKKGNSALSECRYNGNHFIIECVNNLNIDTLPTEGDLLGNNGTGNGWIVIHSLVTDDINIREELSKIGNCDIVSAQIVGKELILTKQDGSTFNIDLTPVLKANNVSFDNATSGLQATTVQGAIDEIDGKVNNAYIDANFDDVSGDLTLIKPNGQNSVLSLSSLLFDVTFDDTNNTLNKVQNGVTTPVIDHVVTEWDDLEFVSKTKGDIRNIFNKHTQIVKNKYFTPVTNGHEIRVNADWDLAYIPIVAGQQVTIVKNVHDSRNYCVCNAQNRIYEAFSVNNTTVNGMYVYHITIGNNLPQDEDCYLAVNMHKTGNNPVDPNKVMVFNGDIANDDLPKEYIPYATHGSIFIDGSEVVHTFNPQGSTLVSQNTQDAIIELDNKITIINESSVKTVNNQRPDAQGNVQVEIGHITGLQNALDGKVNITQLSPISQPNKVPQLDQNGKLDTAMIPDLSINQVHSVANKQEALDLINAGTADIGHVFILRDDNNSVHMYVNQAGTGFDDKCVQLTMSNGSIVSVNQITGDATGNVTLNANQIRLEAKPTVTVEEELGKKVSTINSVAPNAQGNVDLELGVASDKLQLKVNNTEKSTLNLYTDAEADDLIAYFI